MNKVDFDYEFVDIFLLRSPDSETGGYDYDFAETPPDKYLCCICTNVLRDARLTECCGQHYCNSCLSRWLDRKKTCPHCREDDFKSMVNRAVIREINELRIRCNYREKGCDWVGELGVIKQHFKGCDYVEVKCTNSGYHIPNHVYPVLPIHITQVKCEKMEERRYLANHQKECKYRQYTCEYCGYVDTYDAIAGTGRVRNEPTCVTLQGNHYNVCAHRPLQCPNKCRGKNIKRMDMVAHRKSCPLEPLDCPFKSIGCKDKVRRKDMDNEEAHWALVDQELGHKNVELRCTKDELGRTKEELGRTQEKLGRTKEELGYAKGELDCRNKELGRTKKELDCVKVKLDRTKEKLDRAKERLAYTKEELDRKNEVLGRMREELANKSKGLVLQLVRTNVLNWKFSASIGKMEMEMYYSDVLFHPFTICFIILTVISWIYRLLVY